MRYNPETNEIEPEPQTKAEYKAAVALLFAEMRKIDESIKDSQAEIDRLKIETRLILENLKSEMARGNASAELKASN